jgi:hypothetical protein
MVLISVIERGVTGRDEPCADQPVAYEFAFDRVGTVQVVPRETELILQRLVPLCSKW